MAVMDVVNTEQGTHFKAISGQIGIDKAQGIVEAFVSGIGNKDSVGDVVVSGAFNGSLKRRKPRVVWGHDWNQPIGKVLEIYEVPASDPRLPQKMKDAKIGGLFAKVQFNLNTERGREAFANVAFYGTEQEWSIGYKTLTADFDSVRQANMLKEVELYEISPVLHGANQLTGTISVKDDERGSEVKEDMRPAPSSNIDAVSERIGGLLSQALQKPVQIVEMNDNTVVFQTGEGMTWSASISMDNGEVSIVAPTRVKATTSYIPVEEEPPMDMVTKFPEEKEDDLSGARNAVDEQGSWGTPDIALAWSKTLGCDGYHSHGNGYMPCSTHEEYMEAIKKFDNNANINSTNNYIAGVEVTEAKEACSCQSEKGHGYYDKPESYEKPDFLSDPMTLILMAYNEMLKMKGAGDVRDATLALIAALSDYMTKKMDSDGDMDNSPTVEYDREEKITSGFVLHVKCSAKEALKASNAVASLPVFSSKSDDGLDVHFTTEMSEKELMVKVANALASLDFNPDISVSRNVDTQSTVR